MVYIICSTFYVPVSSLFAHLAIWLQSPSVCHFSEVPYQKARYGCQGLHCGKRIERPSLDVWRLTTAEASPRPQLVRDDTLCSMEAFSEQRGNYLQRCLSIQDLAASVDIATADAYTQRPPSASSYIIEAEKLYVQRYTSVARVKLHITGGYNQLHRAKSLPHRHRNHATFRVAGKREAWHEHGAVIQQRFLPPRLHKSSTPWLLAMVVCGV